MAVAWPTLGHCQGDNPTSLMLITAFFILIWPEGHREPQNEDYEHFMAHFYGWGSSTSRLQSLFEEVVYFLPLSSQEFQVFIRFDQPLKDEKGFLSPAEQLVGIVKQEPSNSIVTP